MSASEDKLARGIALFNSGKAAAALKIFEEVATESGKAGDNARLFLQHATAAPARSEAVQPPEAKALLAAAAAGEPAALARAGRRLFKNAPSPAYRLWRDLWLSGTATAFATGAAARSRAPWAQALRSSLEWAAGRDEAALALLASSARAKETAWSRYFAAEIVMRRLDLYDEAVRHCRLVKRECPWLWEASMLEAEARWSRGEDAAKALSPLAKLSPPGASRPSFLAWRGALKTWAGRPAEAFADLDESVAAGNHNAHCWRGAARALTGDAAGAVADLDAVVASDPGDDEALIWRAEANLALGRRDDARRDLDLAASRGALWAFALRARLALDENRLDAARDEFARLMPPVYEDAPDDGQAGIDRGRRGGAAVALGAGRLRELLDGAFKAAGGVRRSDAHLNRAWMAAAGASPAPRPAPDERLYAWWTSRGVDCPAPVVVDPASAKRIHALLK